VLPFNQLRLACNVDLEQDMGIVVFDLLGDVATGTTPARLALGHWMQRKALCSNKKQFLRIKSNQSTR